MKQVRLGTGKGSGVNVVDPDFLAAVYDRIEPRQVIILVCFKMVVAISVIVTERNNSWRTIDGMLSVNARKSEIGDTSHAEN